MTAARDLLCRLPDCLCALLNGHAAACSLIAFSMAMSPQLPSFGVPRRPQRQDFMRDLWADRYVAPGVRACPTTLAVCKSP
jgi:hypothetical protein